jgi:hypothetical protein
LASREPGRTDTTSWSRPRSSAVVRQPHRHQRLARSATLVPVGHDRVAHVQGGWLVQQRVAADTGEQACPAARRTATTSTRCGRRRPAPRG